MLPINKLLERFKNITNTEKEKKKHICGVFNTHNIPITVDQVSFSKTTIFLKVPPIIKTELSVNKELILSEIKSINGLSGVTDIR